jgi:hypothetical protein
MGQVSADQRIDITRPDTPTNRRESLQLSDYYEPHPTHSAELPAAGETARRGEGLEVQHLTSLDSSCTANVPQAYSPLLLLMAVLSVFLPDTFMSHTEAGSGLWPQSLWIHGHGAGS